MNKKNKIVIIVAIIIFLILGVVLYFIINSNKKGINPITNSESMNSSQNININEDNAQKEESIAEKKDEGTTSNNSTSENSDNVTSDNSAINANPSTNNSDNSTSETNPITIERTFSQKDLKTSEGINLKYWLYTPKNPTDNMPLIVYLHGGSARGDDLNKVVEGSFPKYLKDGDLGDINAYVIMPQVPANYKGWSDIKVSVRDLITNIKSTYGINQNKISLTGHSMGGKGTYDIALAYPNLFSCIAPMSGSITVNDINVNKLKNLPIWAFVGSSDTIVDPSTSTNFLTEIKKFNSNSKLTTFDGATHFDVPDLGYKNTDVINWLINTSK